MNIRPAVIIILIIFSASAVPAQGSSRQNWQTHFEKSNFLETPRYKETMEYFKKFGEASEYVKMFSFGLSPQKRKLYALIISKGKNFDYLSARNSGKPLVMIINGIHSGEIEGKDACMLLLREILITKEKMNLLDNLNLLIVPIFSVDAHERMSKYNRINQNGPEEMGWRTTSQNLNLNRDWMKADAPEMQAMLKLFSTWLPDFFIDSHTTDGADYQYTVTYGIEKFQNTSDAIAKTVKKSFIPFLEKNVNKSGYLIAPYVGFKDDDIEKGIVDWAGTPRFSNGYAAVQNRIGLLIETHMLKPYKDRVFATKAVIETSLKYVNQNWEELKLLSKAADEETIIRFSVERNVFPLNFKGGKAFTNFQFKGIKIKKDSSLISGTIKIEFTGEKFEKDIPYFNSVITVDSVVPPFAYLIPIEYEYLAERMKLHGILVEQLAESRILSVERYKFKNVKFSQTPYEGRQQVNCDYDSYMESINIPAGTFIVKTDQRGVRIIIHLLEPKSADSYLRWGFLNAIFERKEYFEDYVMEKIAGDMLKENTPLKNEFEKLLTEDEDFRNSPLQRLNFFYERSPYFDKNMNLYPIMRVNEKF